MLNLPKPSKKILILIGCAVTVIIIVSINKFYRPTAPAPKVEQFQNTRPNRVQKIDPALEDTDKDGLPDWQETITGTDIHKADTDGDGTDDGAELKLGRNPTKPGPHDEETDFTSTSDTKSSSTTATVSDTVARNLFANAVYMSNNGEVTEENKQSLVNNLVTGIQKSFTFKEYTNDGLVSLPADSIDSIRTYATNFATLQVGMVLQMQKNISKIENNVGVLGEIYSKQARDMYSINVPKVLREIHLQIVNNYSKGGSVFEAIANEKKDPMKLPFAIRTYQDIVTEQPILIRQIAQFIKDNGIIFTNNDIGGYWNAAE